MNKLRFLALGLILGLVVISSCKKDDDDDVVVINEAEVLAEYLEANGDYINAYAPAIIGAADLQSLNATGDAYIIDIRGAAAYDTAHIENAVNVAFGDLLTHYETNNLSTYEKVVLVCYSGQTAAYGTSLLQLAGYDNVYSLKWGMCSWNADFAGSWNSNIGNTYATDMTTDVTDKNAAGELPTLTTNLTTGAEILEARLATLFSEGFDAAKITNSTVFGNTSGYYIVNYWSEAHYSVGHIPGAIQYTPKESWSLDTDLKTLPTDETIVVYCYTGQTSANVAAFLRLLGYDAKTLLFGANGLFYDTMISEGLGHTWSDTEIAGYTYWTAP